MSVEAEAKAAAELEYPVDLYTSAREAKPQRVPYAHGYQAGHAAGLVAGREELADYLRSMGHESLASVAVIQLKVRDKLEAQR